MSGLFYFKVRVHSWALLLRCLVNIKRSASQSGNLTWNRCGKKKDTSRYLWVEILDLFIHLLSTYVTRVQCPRCLPHEYRVPVFRRQPSVGRNKVCTALALEESRRAEYGGTRLYPWHCLVRPHLRWQQTRKRAWILKVLLSLAWWHEGFSQRGVGHRLEAVLVSGLCLVQNISMDFHHLVRRCSRATQLLWIWGKV